MDNDYVIIPNFTNYKISKDGTVISLKTNKKLKTVLGNAGYEQYMLNRDDGFRTSVGKHRLLCLVFKPIDHPELFQVNHINGNKRDNTLSNLEWVKPSENDEHAGFNRLTEKCKPVDVLNILTNTVRTFPSYTKCGKYFGVTKDAISDRTKHPTTLYNNCYLFREHSDKSWDKIPDELLQYARSVNPIATSLIHLRRQRASHPVQIRELLTGKIHAFNSLEELADFLNVKNGTISRWLSQQKQPVVPGYYQIKLLSNTDDWEDVDPYFALMQTTGRIPVEVIDIHSGKHTVYSSISEAASSEGYKPYQMYNCIQSRGRIIYPGGKRIGYYPIHD